MRILPSFASPRRNRQIDFLRGLSIGCVFLAHSILCGDFSESLVVSSKFMGDVARNGYYGVSMFFVISGYIITTTSLQRYQEFRRVRLRQFFVFRLSRILPPLLLLVAVNLLLRRIGPAGFALTPEISLGRLFAYLFTFRFNLLYLAGGYNLAAWAVLWSLAIEEVFYLAFPVVCRVLRYEGLICALFLLVVAYGPIYRTAHGWGSLYMYQGCFDQLALGCLTAVAVRRSGASGWPPWILGSFRGVGLVVAACAYFWADIHQNVVAGPSLVALGAAIFLFGTATPSGSAAPFAGPSWVGRAIGLCGFLSYELYLFHPPFFLLAKPWLIHLAAKVGGPLPFDAAFGAVVAVLVGFISWIAAGYSEPILRFLRKALAPLAERKTALVKR